MTFKAGQRVRVHAERVYDATVVEDDMDARLVAVSDAKKEIPKGAPLYVCVHAKTRDEAERERTGPRDQVHWWEPIE